MEITMHKMPGSNPAASTNMKFFSCNRVMAINSSQFLYLQEDYEKYQSMCIAEDMYSTATNAARFEIVRNTLHTYTIHQANCSMLFPYNSPIVY
jgi:hypothetical protein